MSFRKVSLHTHLVVQLILVIIISDGCWACYKFNTERQSDFLHKWKDLGKTIYAGSSVDELLNLCPNGCGDDCTIDVSVTPCTVDDILVLRKAQDIVQGWKVMISEVKTALIIRSVIVVIVFILIVVLIYRGHYRFRDLWMKPSYRQWELEEDPTWGLPGKVWSLLKIRVVKSANTDPTDRKYWSYTENPTVMGNKFWYYKHALGEIYLPHKYYKHTRKFHKMAWQILRMGVVIPEVLRQHLHKRETDQYEPKTGHSDHAMQESEVRLPWEVDLAAELNEVRLRKAKEILKQAIAKEKRKGHWINGRSQDPQSLRKSTRHHHHHQHHVLLPPLTKKEVIQFARLKEDDPHREFVTVEGTMRPTPARVKRNRKWESEIAVDGEDLQNADDIDEEFESDEGTNDQKQGGVK